MADPELDTDLQAVRDLKDHQDLLEHLFMFLHGELNPHGTEHDDHNVREYHATVWYNAVQEMLRPKWHCHHC